MSGIVIASLVAAVLVGGATDMQPCIVQIEHMSLTFVDGEPVPAEQVRCRLEVVSGNNCPFDVRSRIDMATTEVRGTVVLALTGKVRVDFQYTHTIEQSSGNPPDVLGTQTSAEIELGESVVVGGTESITTAVVDGSPSLTRIKRDRIKLSVRRQAPQ